MIHHPSAELINFHRRLGDARLLRELHRYSVGQAQDAFVELCMSMPVSSAAARLAAALANRGVGVITILDPEYPACFRSLDDDAPPILYFIGDITRLKTRSVAIIGTRRPSASGKAASRTVAESLTKNGWMVVSGNAPGVDATAHEAALIHGGETLVFPPGPMDQYMQIFKGSFPDRITVASPFVPGSSIMPWMFLRRNTLVAAQCRAAFVAETGIRGGTLDTVRKLRRFERQVFATRLPQTARHYKAHNMLAADGTVLLDLDFGTAECCSLLIEAAETARYFPVLTTHVLDDLFSGTGND